MQVNDKVKVYLETLDFLLQITIIINVRNRKGRRK